MTKSIYFAHPVNSYGTAIETAVEMLIRVALPGYRIESPNQKFHQEAYEAMQKETAQNRDIHNAMQYFFKVVQPMCVGTVAMPFLDGKMGLGVAGEVIRDADDGKPTWFVEPYTPFYFILMGPKSWIRGWIRIAVREFLSDPLQNPLFGIRPFTGNEIGIIRNEVAEHQAHIKIGGEWSGATLVLSHQETRLRTFYQYQGKTRRPYEEAHLVHMPPPDDFYALVEKK